jgi:hypothetical protein
MNTAKAFGTDVWPVSHESRDGRHLLEKVVIRSDHADGRGALELTVDQALHVQGRLSQIAVTFLPHHQSTGTHPRHQTTTHPDGPAVHTLAACGAEAWPVICDETALPADLEKVVVESDRPHARGPIHLSPEQVLYVEECLQRIAFEYLHDHGWGGEDARSQ